MAENIIPVGADAGMASGVDSDTYVHRPLWTGNAPTRSSNEVAAEAPLAALTVVGRNADLELVPATYATDDTGVAPIGVTAAAVLEDATALNVPVWLDGQFNPDALVWDDSFDTDDKKAHAFDGTPIDMRPVAFKEGL